MSDTTAKIKTPDEIDVISATLRAQGKKIVTTNGCFDLLHYGHCRMLQYAKAQGDVLIVLTNSDRSVHERKGDNRPVLPEKERAALLAALACTDYVVVFDELKPEPLIARIKPDVQVNGESVTGALGKFVQEWGGNQKVAGVENGISTSGIIKLIVQRFKNDPKFQDRT